VDGVEELLPFSFPSAFVEAVDGENTMLGDIHQLRYGLQGEKDEALDLLDQRLLKYARGVPYGLGNIGSKGGDALCELLGDSEDERLRVVEVCDPRGEKVGCREHPTFFASLCHFP